MTVTLAEPEDQGPYAPSGTSPRRSGPFRAVHVGDSSHELHLGAIDGPVTRVPDTPANREPFGSTGTADDSSPYPQVGDLRAADASARGTLVVVSGPSGGLKAEGECCTYALIGI